MGQSARGVTGAAGRRGHSLRADCRDRADIPQATVTRLATYLRVLGVLAERGTSDRLQRGTRAAAGVGSAKLRKDLSLPGAQRRSRRRLRRRRLQSRIETRPRPRPRPRVVLVGVGNLGQALAGYGGFGRRGFAMVALFDADPERRRNRGRRPDRPRTSTNSKPPARELGATIGVIATPTTPRRTCATSSSRPGCAAS